MTKLRVTVVNHVRHEVACPAEKLWAAILDDIAGGQSYAQYGYVITPLDDPSAHLGGNRLKVETPELTDEIVYRISERDDKAMRLSLRADFLLAPTKMTAFSTYRAVPTDRGCAYQMDCHSTLDHDVPDGASKAEIAASVAALHNQFQQGIASALARLGARLEQ